MPVSTQSPTPMELLGAHSGVNVIDPSTILTRLWYFDGRFLRASGFRMDQDYVRSLVALSNQAVGHGVVSGFTPTLAGGNVISVAGGLGLAPNGRPVYLPSAVELSIAKLIDRSAGTFNPASRPVAGTADFALCPPDPPVADVETPPVSTVYLLTVAAAEALCGEEEKFGQLCEDACAGESDRSVAVEGVCFRVRPLSLSLSVSETVPFGDVHHRSRVASAYFAAERLAVASMISGAGLRSSVWCTGAPGVGGEEIPLAVFDRVGAVTSWLDLWTARRELNETNPQRYWSQRFAMRPLDVFWAQVLQFQCQLLSLGSTPSGGGGAGDSCAEERQTLQAASAMIDTFLTVSTERGSAERESAVIGSMERALADVGSAGRSTPVAAATVPSFTIPKLAQDRLLELSGLIDRTLSGRTPSSTGSLLLDGGIIEVPSAGYLPVNPDRDIQDQVRAFMGPGVDLRFCAVRPDFIPEAFQEAQHMERISLTAGIDNPAMLEEVDVLVPGGRIEEVREQLVAFQGIARVVPDPDNRERSPLQLRVIGREHAESTWSWTLAGHSETKAGLRIDDIRSAAGAFLRGREIDDAAVRERVVDLAEADADFEVRLSPDLTRRSLFRLRAERSDPMIAAARRDQELISVWLDFSVDGDLRNTSIGERINARVAGTVHAFNGAEENLYDYRYQGDLVVAAHQRRSDGSVRIRTAITGFIDAFSFENGNVDDENVPAKGYAIDWTFSRAGDAEQLTMSMLLDADSENPSTLTLELQQVGSPRRVGGTLVNTGSRGDNEPFVHRIGDAALEETPGALDPGGFGRDLADGVIDVVGAAMARTGRDGNWGVVAERRLLGGLVGGGSTAVRSDGDWVMFHRRRTKVCGGDRPDEPVAIRTYRWYHADVANLTDELRKKIQTELASATPERRAAIIAEFDFSLVSSLSFQQGAGELVSSPVALRADWSARVVSEALVGAVVADPPTGDGAVVALARLTSALNAIAGLVDTSDLQPPSVVGEIPVEYRTRGTDGVIFSVGSSRIDVDRAAAQLVRLPMRALDLVHSLQGEMNLEILREQLANFGLTEQDFFVARYVGDDVENRRDVLNWWGDNDVPTAVRLGTGGDLSQEELRRWVGPRGEAMTGLFGLANIVERLEATKWELAQADVAMLLFVESGRDFDFDDAVFEVVTTAEPDFRRREFQILEAALLESNPTPDELRAVATDFDISVDRIDWTQPLKTVGREVIKIARESDRYREFVTEIRDRRRDR